ncbi:DUF7002 family protein [Streptomyces mirabilis]|uniref:DUF7002 family protein n=1 Tax=Streptomyces mirabilis TaxID=68239 RepID=UPI00331A881E
MDPERLVREHPRLFHMAHDGSWPSIREHGLLSTRALVDLYAPPSELRSAVLDGVRRTSVVLERHGLDRVVLRDQGPLKFLDACLAPGTTAQEFLDLLNGRVFFWLSRSRLQRLLGAARYRSQAQTVLQFDTAEVLARYGKQVQLAPFNTGSMHVPPPHSPVRGRDAFRDVEDYPFDHWRAKRGNSGDAVVELTIPTAVPDAGELAVRVERWINVAPVETLHVR